MECERLSLFSITTTLRHSTSRGKRRQQSLRLFSTESVCPPLHRMPQNLHDAVTRDGNPPQTVRGIAGEPTFFYL